MTLKYLIKDLENLTEDINVWIEDLKALEEKDVKRFFKKGIKAPSIRIRSKLKSIIDKALKHRKIILQHRKEIETFKGSPLEVNYKKSRRRSKDDNV